MEYTSGAGPKASEANSRIYNLKARERDAESEGHLYCIKRRRQDFANDLKPVIESLLKMGSDGIVGLTFVPTSKHLDDPDYNDCFETVCKHLKETFDQKIIIEKPFDTVASREPSSITGGTRDREYVKKLKSNLKWLGLKCESNTLIIFDDVIKTGAHFTALREIITENTAKPPQIIGLF